MIDSDTKGAADAYIWQANIERLEQPYKRGRKKIATQVLNRELQAKTEALGRMEKSLDLLRTFNKNQIISDSDLEEFDALMSTDEEDTEPVPREGKSNTNATCIVDSEISRSIRHE